MTDKNSYSNKIFRLSLEYIQCEVSTSEFVEVIEELAKWIASFSTNE